MTNKAGSYSVEWNKAGSIRVDARTGPRFKPAMLWPPDVKGREEDDYFFHFFPRTMAEGIEGWSNEARCADAEGAKTKPITHCEIVMALGYLVAAASGNVSVKQDLFRATPADVDCEDGEEGEEDRLFPGPSFGSRFGMSKHRFFFVLRFMRFGSKSKDDKWSLVRPIVGTFNQARVDGFQSGWQICVGESMSAWRGRDGEMAADGMPHVTKMKRRPKGVGGEFENSADVATGVCLRLDLATLLQAAVLCGTQHDTKACLS
jgi:hypothetical protein